MSDSLQSSDYIACQAPLSMGFSRQEYWSGLPFPLGDLPDPGMEPESLTSPALAGRFPTTSSTWEAQYSLYILLVLFLWRTQSDTICDFYVLFKKFSSILKS